MDKYPVVYDSLRDESTARGEKKDCAVIALAVACRVDYATAHEALRLSGRKDKDGTPFDVTRAAVTRLGYKLHAYKRTTQKGGSRYTPRTIGGRLKKGYYLCRIVNRHTGHIFGVVNGQVMDHTAGGCHRIKYIYRVTKERTNV